MTTICSHAQILNDSASAPYGSRTTYFVLENDILNLDSTRHSLDTSANDLHNLPHIVGLNTFYQNLGVFGTATQGYGYSMPARPGRRIGFDVFDLYLFKSSDVKYYNTRSPYSEVKYVQSTRGSQLIDITFSRNINFHWNFGFDVRHFVSKKNIGLVRRENQARANGFDFYTRYFTARGRKYQIFANFVYADMLQQETGGIEPKATDGGSLDSLYDDIREYMFLNRSRSGDKRFEYHIYQELPIFKDNSLQIYNRFDYSRSFLWMKQENSRGDTLFMDSLNLPRQGTFEQQSTFNNTFFHLRENEGGIKGILGGGGI